MGKSYNNDIKISDTAEVTAKKIMQAITDQAAIRRDDWATQTNAKLHSSTGKFLAMNRQLQPLNANASKEPRGCADCNPAWCGD